MFAKKFNLSDLASLNGGNGTNGFIIKAINNGDNLGVSVSSAGDVNGDGIDDLVAGASGVYDPNSALNSPGKGYVIFGKSTFQAEINLSDIASGDGTEGFIVNGIDNGDNLGISVSSAGDINNDGTDDIIIGARSADGENNNSQSAGESYVVYGGTNLGTEVNLSDIVDGDGSDGFVVYGVINGDILGTSVSSAGDFNGDDIDDVIVGVKFADDSDNIDSGKTYIVFGGDDLAEKIDLSDIADGDGSEGLLVSGADEYDFSGSSVSDAGDANGDGIDDIIISSPGSYGNNNDVDFSGESYVVFGDSDLGAEINLSDIASGNGSNGFVVYGVDEYDFLGTSVSSAGDFNGDDIDDIIISAESGNGENNNTSYSGESYVVFGNRNLGGEVNLSDIASGDGSHGFVVNGIDEYDFSGSSVSSAGDINGDGKDDIVIGARSADGDGSNNSKQDSGESYVVFGSSDLGAEINLSDITAGDGNDGFIVDGVDAGGSLGIAVSDAGDVNGDGIEDLVLGANTADSDSDTLDSGESYVIFGKIDPNSISDSVTVGDNNLFGTNLGDRLEGGAGNDITRGGNGDDVVDGDNGKDRLFGDGGADQLNGGKNDDFLQGGDNNDLVRGGRGDDIVYGDEGNDTLLGGSGGDVLSGDEGDDLLDGGTGIDRMLGGSGVDTFVVRSGDFNNVIYDFEDTKDLIRLDAGLTFANLTITDNGLNTGTNIIQTSNSNLLTSLIDVDEINITSEDFI